MPGTDPDGSDYRWDETELDAADQGIPYPVT